MPTNQSVHPQATLQTTSYRLLLLGSILVGFALRHVRLGGESLWYDETVSVYLAQKSIPDMLAHTAGDIHPPGYYFLLHLWQMITQPTLAHGMEFLYAWPSLCFGMLLLVLIYALGRKLFNATTGLIAVWLTAIHPFHLWYSQEVRMYTLGALLGLLCLWSLLKIAEDSSQQPTKMARWLIVYALSAAAGMYTLYYFVFLLLALNLIALLLLRQKLRIFGYWIAAQFATLLLWSPWLPIFYHQATNPPVPPWRVPWATWSGLFGSIAESFGALSVGQSPPLGQYLPWALLSMLSLTLFFYAKSPGNKANFTTKWILVLYLFVPIVLIYLISYFVTPLYHVRYLFTHAAPIALIAAVAIESLARQVRPLAVSLGLLLLATSSTSLYEFWTNPLYRADDHRGAVADVAKGWRPGDLILVNAGWAYPPLAIYWPTELEGAMSSLPPKLAAIQRLGDQVISDDLSQPTIVRTGSIDGDANLGWGDPASDFFAISDASAISSLQQLAKQSSTIWHYRIYDTVSDPNGSLRQWLEQFPMAEDHLHSGRDFLRVQRFLVPESLQTASTATTSKSVRFSPLSMPQVDFDTVLTLSAMGILSQNMAVSNADPSQNTPFAPAGEALYVLLDWLPQVDLASLGSNLSMSLRIYDSSGNLYAQSDEAPLTASSEWTAQRHYQQIMALGIPVSTMPDSYSLELVAYRQDNGEALTLAETPFSVQGQRLKLAQVEVQSARQIPEINHVLASFDYVDLISTQVDRTVLNAGETLHVELVWRPEPSQYTDTYAATVELVNAAGQSVQSWKALIGSDAYPSGHWPALIPVRDLRQIELGKELASGTYSLQLRLERNSDQLPIAARSGWGLRKRAAIQLGSIQIN